VLKVVHFLRTKKRAWFGVYFSIPIHNLTQNHLIKKFLRHFLTALVPSLTLRISDIIQSSLESHTLEFFAYHLPCLRSRCLVKWQREVKLCKVSDGTRVVGKSLRNFLSRLRKGMEKYTPKPCARNTQLLALNAS
jgi:hypothetical protein